MISNFASRHLIRASAASSRQGMMLRRTMATAETATSAPARSGGATLFQRLSSFLAGAGLTALGTQFYLYQEISSGNKLMISKQKELEQRIRSLEESK
eukprot:CAMPEP_0119551300 /NCGR_PEP_ID=MMETSP1352-20130426/4590_1 /TAXON_ID=265584 /ORGANISM="Stauroneis constricta, Strain CCMP1120" /LENGTH=97 /DNA_ID=CAMNT_0007597331 /DNA_START=23 /DNA_END=316 /DNA_ORIENTATION=+